MKTELDVLRDVTEKLDAAGIAYMLTGSMAMNHYATPRMTRDIDIVIALPLEEAERLVACFVGHYHTDVDELRDAVARQSMFNFIHLDTMVKIDGILRKEEPYRRTEFDRRRRVCIDGFGVWIVSKEDLILSKLVWMKDSQSDMQKNDIVNLLASGYDRVYCEKWAGELSVSSLLNTLTDE